MMTEEDIDALVEAARYALGTKFHHQGRTIGAGLDCIGLIVVSFLAIGRDVQDRQDYGPRPDGISLVAALEEHGAQKVNEIRKGDILLFRYDNQPQHVALATSATTLIHSFAPAGQVVETSIGRYWRSRLVGIYRI